MDDTQIIELFFQRDERAISEADRKYGRLCRRVAENLLSVREDAEECVNDAYRRLWAAIPPERPESLKAYLCRVVRNLALNLCDRKHAQKRSGAEVLLSELNDCVPAAQTVEGEIEDRELGKLISAWLRTLDKDDRTLFVRRYYYGERLKKIAVERGVSENRLAQRLFRLRTSLRERLEEEGVFL